MRYIKELESIRAAAIALVFIWHGLPKNLTVHKFLPGPMGVNLFFVLSGFLITQILLHNRSKTERLNGKKSTILGSFYIRRILRIVPIYVLTIFAIILLRHTLKLDYTKGELVSNLTYTTNFFIYSKQEWPLATPHFWSLAVEEQFYLLWPLLMLFLPKKVIVPTIISFIAIGFISQSFAVDSNFSPLLPNQCFDCLGLGALLAWIYVHKPQLLPKFYRLATGAMILSVAIFGLHVAELVQVKQIRFLHAIWGVWIITYVLHYAGKSTLLISILNNRFFRSVGKVSYGIYLYHVLFFYLMAQLWGNLLMEYCLPIYQQAYGPWLFLILDFVILYSLCLLSWRWIEKPILSLKRVAQYQKPLKELQPDKSLVEQ